MAFAYDIVQVLTHVGMVHSSAQKDPQRLVVVSRSVKATGDLPQDRRYYWCRAIVEGERCQYAERELIECVEEELIPYPI